MVQIFAVETALVTGSLPDSRNLRVGPYDVRMVFFTIEAVNGLHACILPFFIPEDCVEGAADNKIVFVLIICGYLTHVFGNLPIVIGGKFEWGGRTVSIDNIGEFFAVHINVPLSR